MWRRKGVLLSAVVAVAAAIAAAPLSPHAAIATIGLHAAATGAVVDDATLFNGGIAASAGTLLALIVGYSA